MAKKDTSSEKTKESKESQATTDSVMKYKTWLIIAGLAAIVFAAFAMFSGDDSSSSEKNAQTQTPQQQTTDTQEETAPAEVISFKQPEWASDLKAQCKPCLGSPAGCNHLGKPIAYACTTPSDLPSDGTWSCTRKVEGELSGSSTKGSCAESYTNYVRIRPDENSKVTVCCAYSYTDPSTGQQKKSAEECSEIVYPMAC